MKVELFDLKKLVPYARNPRITAHAVDKVAASIKEFGFRQPIVVDSEMVIIAGHTRYQAAQKLGLKKVPVHVAEGLSAEQVKAYRISAAPGAGVIVSSDFDFDVPVRFDTDTLAVRADGPGFFVWDSIPIVEIRL